MVVCVRVHTLQISAFCCLLVFMVIHAVNLSFICFESSALHLLYRFFLSISRSFLFHIPFNKTIFVYSSHFSRNWDFFFSLLISFIPRFLFGLNSHCYVHKTRLNWYLIFLAIFFVVFITVRACLLMMSPSVWWTSSRTSSCRLWSLHILINFTSSDLLVCCLFFLNFTHFAASLSS